MKNELSHILLDLLLKPSRRFYRHLIVQAIIVFITLSNLLYAPYAFWGERLPFWFVPLAGLNVLVYINTYLLVPRMLLNGKARLYFLSVLGLLVFSILLSLIGYVAAAQHSVTVKESLFILLSAIPEVTVLLAGITASLLFRHCLENKQRIQELQTATMEVELANLKNQINPHFLFNMLNNANVLIRKNPAEASQILYKLEDLLRYQINDSSREHVSLSSEIRFLNDFLNLEKIRRDKFTFTLAREGEIETVNLPPLLFIPFVENAVKHNFDSENPSYVHLSFIVCDKRLEFMCENSKPIKTSFDSTTEKVGGIGLANIQRRLELLYPNRYQLKINEIEYTYSVKLYLDL